MATPSIDHLLATLSSPPIYLHARPSVLKTLLSSLRPVPPGRALIETLKFRVLASDITQSLQPHANLCFPPTLPSAAPRELVLPAEPIVVQVVDVIDLGQSRLDALEKLEMAELGEVVRGKEIIRVLPSEDGAGGAGGAGGGEAQGGGGKGVNKLLLEDAAGRRVWAFELAPVKGVKVGMNIGCKILLRGCAVGRGVVLLTPETASVLGGLVEAMQKQWVGGRKGRLVAEIEALKGGG